MRREPAVAAEQKADEFIRAHRDEIGRGRARALSFAADQPLKSPRVFETEPAIDLAAVWRGIEDGHELGSRKLAHRLLHQPRCKAAAAIIRSNQYHADPG